MTPGTYESDKTINIIGIEKIHSKYDCNDGSFDNGQRDPILCSFVFSSPPGLKKPKEPRIKSFKKINKSVLSPITFYLEDDDHKSLDFKNEVTSFTCQLIKI